MPVFALGIAPCGVEVDIDAVRTYRLSIPTTIDMNGACVNLSPPDSTLLISTVAGLLGAIALTVWLRKSAPNPVPGLAPADRFGAALIAGGALLIGIMSIGNALAATIRTLSPGSTTVLGMELAIPQPTPNVAALPNVESAASPTVDVTFADAPPRVAAWLLTAELLPMLLVLAICASAIWLSIGLVHGRPFTRRFPIALVCVAGAVMICGIGSQLATAIARAEVALVLNTASPQIEPGFALFSIALDLSPFGWGLLLGLLAGAFQVGTRMQRETELLV